MPNAASTSDLGRFWTIPNVLTLFRLVLTIPITVLIFQDGPLLWIMGLVVFAVATDYFDGRVARWSDTVSDWGKVLDPFVDKVAAGLVVTALTMRGSLPLWFLAAIVVRDLSIFAGGAIIRVKTGQIVMSLWSGKVAVTAIAVTVLAVLLKADPPLLEQCIWITTALLAWSFVRYFIRFFVLLGRASDAHAEVEEDI
jgi:CDP-diacylglycerol--glycerol-3-phosphate 3-phosphatidyltransferase